MNHLQRSTVVFVLVLLLIFLLAGQVLAAPESTVTLTVPAEVPIGEAFTFTATFDNTHATDVGYGPFIDVVLPTNGADGLGNTNPPLDGISYISASYLGFPVTITVQTFTNAPLGVLPCGPTQSTLDHPYAVDTSNVPLPVCGTPGDTLITVQLPFGSFSPDQPPAPVEFNVQLSNLADLGTPLIVTARGGYEFGANALDDFCCDPTILSQSSPDSGSWNPSASVTPTLITIDKENSAPEDETATGPNYPRTYTITVDVASGQTVANTEVTDVVTGTIVIQSVAGATLIGLNGGAAPAALYNQPW
jgi:large repetitive protein